MALLCGMNELVSPWVFLVYILAYIIGFAAFFSLIVLVLSFLAWSRLANEYPAPDQLAVPVAIRIGRAKLGLVSYKGIIKAGALAEGLSLRVILVSWLGHPPLLIPWVAIAPIRTHKSFWTTYYSTTIRVGSGQVDFQFSDSELVEALRPWLRME